MRKIALLALGAMLTFGCAHSPPPAPEAPPAHQADAPPPAPPAAAAPASPASTQLTLQMAPRPGWVQLPSSAVPDGVAGVMINPSAHAMIMVMLDAPATDTATAAATAIRAQLATGDNAWTCAPVRASSDGLSASFTLSQADRRGKVTVRRLHENPAVNVGFLGQWPAASAAAARADYDAMVSSATMAAAPAAP